MEKKEKLKMQLLDGQMDVVTQKRVQAWLTVGHLQMKMDR